MLSGLAFPFGMSGLLKVDLFRCVLVSGFRFGIRIIRYSAFEGWGLARSIHREQTYCCFVIFVERYTALLVRGVWRTILRGSLSALLDYIVHSVGGGRDDGSPRGILLSSEKFLLRMQGEG